MISRAQLALTMVAIVLATIAAFVSCRQADDQPTTHSALHGLSFLSGSWEGPIGETLLRAHYTTPEGGMLLSYTEFSHQKKGVASYEFERFALMGEDVIFIPYPAGKRADQLTATEIDAENRRATFENPDKDFPTRVVYECPTPSHLVITLSDPHGDDPDRKQFFRLKRVGTKRSD